MPSGRHSVFVNRSSQLSGNGESTTVLADSTEKETNTNERGRVREYVQNVDKYGAFVG